MSDDKIVMTERRMNAYYYSFDSVGCDPVDKILSAVACAGKAFHHTSDWYEECDWLGHAGTTPVDWIQNAANEAAAEIERLRAKVAWLEKHSDEIEAKLEELRWP